jgi:hypothetical protein
MRKHYFKNILYITLFFSALSILQSCSTSKNIVGSIDQKAEIAIDGNLNEWGNNIQFTEKKNLSVEIQNSPTTLFLAIRVLNPEKAADIMSSGFTIWMDATGKDSKGNGIHIPPVNSYTLDTYHENKKLKKENPNFIYDPINGDSLLKSIQTIEIVKNGKGEQVIPLRNQYGIDVAIASEPYTGGIIYELAIPLKSDAPDYPLAFHTQPGGIISIGFDSFMSGNNQGNNSPVSFSFGLGMGSVGMGRYPYGPYGPGYYPQNRPTSIWVDVRLVRAY